MDTRRMTLIATIAVIALVFVGIGYAYTAYSANNGNNTDVAYITLTQENTTTSAAYTFANDIKIKFDTYNEINSTTTYYKIAEPVNINTTTSTDSYICANLGQVKLTATYTGGTTDPVTKTKVQIADSTGFTTTNNWIYFLTDVPNDNKVTKIYSYKVGDNDWVDGPHALNLAIGSSVTVNVLYGYHATLADLKIGNDYFLEELEAPSKLQNASIVFKATSIENDAQDDTSKLVSITYDQNTAQSNVTKTYTVIKDTKLKLMRCPFTVDSKTFSKWLIDTTEKQVGDEITMSADTTVKAVWVDSTT